MSQSETGVGFCTECSGRIRSWEGLAACPHCGTTGVPCADENQVQVSVNWHELHMLCVWAEHYQRMAGLGNTVYAIARRLRAQYPERTPLTLAEDIGDLSRSIAASGATVAVSSALLRQDIAAQTGEETGLVRPDDIPDDERAP